MTLRRLLYRLGAVLGDVRAVQRGRIGRRLANRAIGRHLVRRLWF